MKKKILVVDDMDINRELLKDILCDEYDVVQAENGKLAIEAISENPGFGAVLLDLTMPEIDGFGVLDFMKKKGLSGRIPVIIISTISDNETEKRCFDYGVSDFVQKPFSNSIVTRRVNNLVNLFAYRNDLEAKVDKKTKLLKLRNAELKQQAQKLSENNIKIIDILGNIVESRSLESGEHIKRVKGLAKILGTRLMQDHPEYGLTPERVDMISQASALHDVGKISIPDNVLLKPGKLTPEEFELMKLHTTKGCDILDKIEDIWDDDYHKASYDICRYHHERYDGRGYPEGLKGEEIPLAAQIVSVVDVYDALVSERVYKAALPKDKAFTMIINGECGAFSPKVLDSFSHARSEFEAFSGGLAC